jgi:hypothetical protein
MSSARIWQRGRPMLRRKLFEFARGFAFALLGVVGTARGQSPGAPRFLTTGIFIGSIEEGARIFTPARLLPLDHPEALGHQFPTVLQLHRDEDRLLILLAQHAGLKLSATLQRYPVQPDTLWPYAPFASPPVAAFQTVAPVTRRATEAPLPGLRAVAFLDRFPLAFIVDTRGMTLAERHMQQATTMGLDVSRAEFIAALERAAMDVPQTGPAMLVYRR